MFDWFKESEQCIITTTFALKPNCRWSLYKNLPYNDNSAASNTFEITGVRVKPRCISTLVKSPCLFFGMGLMIPQQNHRVHRNVVWKQWIRRTARFAPACTKRLFWILSCPPALRSFSIYNINERYFIGSVSMTGHVYSNLCFIGFISLSSIWFIDLLKMRCEFS